MRLYRKEKHWSDYWEVDVNFPWVGRREKLGWVAPEEPYYAYGFSFPTECFLHREDDKLVRCKGKRTNGEQCKMMTTNKSGYCVYHD